MGRMVLGLCGERPAALSGQLFAQKRSFLKKKPTWLVLSDLGAGLLYLLTEALIIIFNIRRLAKFIDLLIVEELSEFPLHCLSGFFVDQLVLTDNGLKVEIGGNHVSGGHDVVIVHSLHEWLHL